MSHCHQRACSGTPHKTTRRDGATVIPLVGSACDCACAECDEESVATGIRAPSTKEKAIMEEQQEEKSESGWAEAAAASGAAAADRRVLERLVAGTAELELPCLLSDGELLEFGASLAEEVGEIATIEAEAKAAAKVFGDRRKIHEAKADELAVIVRAKSQKRRVACTIIHILSLGVARTIRDDTGEIVAERALSYSERQGQLFDMDPEDANLGDDEPEENADLEDKLDAALAEGDADDGTDITNPADLAGDEPAPAKIKRGRGK